MPSSPIDPPNARWTRLQTELRDLAFILDRRGSHAAADVATAVATRIEELLSADEDQPEPGVLAPDRRHDAACHACGI